MNHEIAQLKAKLIRAEDSRNNYKLADMATRAESARLREEVDTLKADNRRLKVIAGGLDKESKDFQTRLEESIAAGADTLVDLKECQRTGTISSNAHLALQHQNDRLCGVFRTMVREVEMLISDKIPYKEHTPHPVYTQTLKLWESLARLNNSPETEAIAHEA